MRVNMLCGLLACALAQPAAFAAPTTNGQVAVDTTVSGVVAQVKGGRVTVRLDDGRSVSYSALPGSVTVGQRIKAAVRRVGDSQRLEGIQVSAR